MEENLCAHGCGCGKPEETEEAPQNLFQMLESGRLHVSYVKLWKATKEAALKHDIQDPEYLAQLDKFLLPYYGIRGSGDEQSVVETGVSLLKRASLPDEGKTYALLVQALLPDLETLHNAMLGLDYLTVHLVASGKLPMYQSNQLTNASDMLSSLLPIVSLLSGLQLPGGVDETTQRMIDRRPAFTPVSYSAEEDLELLAEIDGLLSLPVRVISDAVISVTMPDQQ